MAFVESVENHLISRVISPLLNGELSNIDSLKEIFILPLVRVSNALHLQTGDVALSLAIAPLVPEFLESFVSFGELIRECAIFYDRLEYQVKMPLWLVPNDRLIQDLFDNDRKAFYDLVWLEAHCPDMCNNANFKEIGLRSLATLASNISFLSGVEIEEILHDLMRGSRKLSIFLTNIFPASTNNCFTLSEIHEKIGAFFRQGALNMSKEMVLKMNRTLKLFVSEFEEEIKPSLFVDFGSVKEMRHGIVSRFMVYLLCHSAFAQKKIKNLRNSSFTSQQARFVRANLEHLKMSEINFLYENYFNFCVKEDEESERKLDEDELERQIFDYQNREQGFEGRGFESDLKWVFGSLVY